MAWSIHPGGDGTILHAKDGSCYWVNEDSRLSRTTIKVWLYKASHQSTVGSRYMSETIGAYPTIAAAKVAAMMLETMEGPT